MADFKWEEVLGKWIGISIVFFLLGFLSGSAFGIATLVYRWITQ
jgi:hypothetical protein